VPVLVLCDGGVAQRGALSSPGVRQLKAKVTQKTNPRPVTWLWWCPRGMAPINVVCKALHFASAASLMRANRCVLRSGCASNPQLCRGRWGRVRGPGLEFARTAPTPLLQFRATIWARVDIGMGVGLGYGSPRPQEGSIGGEQWQFEHFGNYPQD
jgi:hypothetical protein